MELKLTNCTKLQSLVQANGKKQQVIKNEETMSIEERGLDQPMEMIEPTQPQVDLAELYDELDQSPPAKKVVNFGGRNIKRRNSESSDDPITAKQLKFQQEESL